MLGLFNKEKEVVPEQNPVQQDNTPESVLTEIDTDHDGKIEVLEAATFILHSRTIQVNMIALIAMFVQSKYGFVISPDLQSEILLVINMWLRTKTTKPIKWAK